MAKIMLIFQRSRTGANKQPGTHTIRQAQGLWRKDLSKKSIAAMPRNPKS
jgi:hypothetical protein